MRTTQLLAVLVVLFDITLATPTAKTARTYHLHEKRAEGLGWQKKSRADVGVTLPLRIGLRQSNLASADQYLWDVSSPNSPNFGTSYEQSYVEITEY
jgi:hypothetical protein